METLCKEVDEKIRVNLENEEIQDIRKAVDKMVERFVEALHDINMEIKIDRLEFCGSMAEGTRIWVPELARGECDLEFDYLAVIKYWPGCGNFVFKPSYEEGKMQIMYEVTDDTSVTGKYINLDTAMKLSFISTVLKGIRAKCESNTCTRQLHNRSAARGCECCTIYMKTGNLRSTDVPVSNGEVKNESVLSFMWSSIKRSVHIPYKFPKLPNRSPDPFAEDMLQIKVDFNPVLEVNKKMIAPKHDGTALPLDESDIYFLFPYLPLLTTSSIYSKWRISTCHSELKLLKETSKEHKLAFCVLKFIAKAFQVYGNIKYVKSYEAKCVVLNHIKNCQAPNRGAHICLLDMIKDMYECARYRNLLHPVLPSCNVYLMDIRSSLDISKPQKAMFFKCLFSLLEQQDHVSVEDLYYDITSLRNMNFVMNNLRRTTDDKLYDNFLKKRREASAKEVLEDENGLAPLPLELEEFKRII